MERHYREGELGDTGPHHESDLETLGAGSNEHGLIFANWQDLLVGIVGE